MPTDIVKHALEIESSLKIVSSTNFEAKLKEISKRIAAAALTGELVENLTTFTAGRIKQVIDETTGQRTDGGGSTAAPTDAKKERKDRAERLASISKGMQTIATTGMNALKTGLGILTDVFERIKAASPLLQAVETLFNLAMQLFFMPLGTKLATVLIPHVTALVENVMKIWDGFEGKSLSEILDTTISIGIEAFGKYFTNLGAELSKSGGILGAIGNMLSMIGSLITNHGEKLIKTVMNILTFVIGHIPEILGAIFTFMAVSKALQVAQIAVLMAINWKTMIAGAAALAAVAGVGVAAGNAAKNYAFAAEGGYFPSTPGGVPVILAEGGEGETVVPDSKKLEFAKSVLPPQQAASAPMNITNNFVFNGYNEAQMVDKIKRTVNEQTNLSRLRSGLS